MGRRVALFAIALAAFAAGAGCKSEEQRASEETPVAKAPDVTAEQAIENVRKSNMTPEQKAMTEAMIRGRAEGKGN